jgi:hypothetical protein
MRLPQTVMLAAPLALRFPLTVELTRMREPPDGTLMVPPTLLPDRQVVPEEATLMLPVEPALVHDSVVVAVEELSVEFESLVADTVAVLETEPDAAGLTCTVMLKAWDPVTEVVAEQFTVPPAPAAGSLQVQPEGWVSDTKVVPDGMASATVAPKAGFDPGLTVMAYGTVEPGVVDPGPVLDTVTSVLGGP